MNADNDHYLDIPEYVDTIPSEEVFNSVLEGHHYAPDETGGTTTLTYSFAGPGSKYDVASYAGDGRNWPDRGLERLSDIEITAFENVLEHVKSFTNLEFIRVEDTGEKAGTIRPAWFSGEGEDFAGYADAPYPAWPAAGDIWFLKDAFTDATLEDFTGVIIHEFGHAIGIKHPHESRGDFGSLSTAWDGREYSIMSYKTSVLHPTAINTDLGPQTFMYLDILALQHIYGADTVTTGGNETYSYSQTERHFLTIWDAGGTDTIEVHSGNRRVEIDLTPGTWINVGTIIQYDTGFSYITEKKTVFIPPEVLIENATGAAGFDILTGNHVSNVLKGNDGDDRLYGMDGADILIGGDGNDKLFGGTGDDALWAGASDTGNDLLFGEAGNDVLGGGPGDDLLVGGGIDDGFIKNLFAPTEDSTADGQDTLYGADGNDTLLGGGWDDGAVTDNGKFDIGEQVTSGTDDNVIWAGNGDDLVYGAAGNDLIGARDGSDTVYAGGGNDTVYGGASVHSDQIFGEAGNDTLYAGAGDDTIDGGAGNDLIADGLGDDVYIGGSGADTFVFTADKGDDRITDFSLSEDILDLSATATNFTSTNDVTSAASTQGNGVLIDLGDGHSLLLDGISLDDLATINFQF